MDMLTQLPEVFVLGFEPLDSPGLSPTQKLAFLEAAWTFPPTPQEFPQWRRELIPSPHIRVNRTLVRHFEQLSGKTVAGLKLRPYVPDLGGVIHTAMTGTVCDIVPLESLFPSPPCQPCMTSCGPQ